MSKFKVCVYAICKNEGKHVDRWYESMKEADEIFVLDTGSEDNTIDKLMEKGINVKKTNINPWRFDIARNESLDQIPYCYDICVCTDLDEVFEPGWRELLENSWNCDTNRLRYTYNWSLDENNKPIVSFLSEKIHSRNGYRWANPVHEILEYKEKDEIININEEIVLNHYPDNQKSRSSYLSLLELSVKETPENDRNMHYLGREYMYHNMYNECIDTLIKHLYLKTSIWKDERSASMRFIARSYQQLKRFDEAKMWLQKAIKETPYLRDPYMEAALLEYRLENWKEVEYYCKKALNITDHEKTYINEPFSWDETVYDLLSIATFYQKEFENSYMWINKAIEINPKNSRLLENLKIIKESLN